MPRGSSGLKAPVITNYTVNGNNSVTLGGTAQANSEVTVYDGQTVLGTTTTNSAGAWTYTTTALAAGTQVFTATVTNAGNTSAASNAVDPFVAGEAGPAVVSVASSGIGIANGNGDLTVGSVVALTLNMSEAVTVAGGTPTLTLDDGGTASYIGGSGSDALTFSYLVAAGQNTSNLTVAAVNLNGATITGAVGNAIFSGILTPAGTLQIDTTPPTVTSVATSGIGITSGNGDIGTGSTVTLMLSMTEAVTVAGGTPTLALDDGGTATYTGGSGSDELSFSYTVADGQNTSDLTATAINLNGASIADAAGNNADLAGTLTPTGTLQVDTTSTIVLTPDNYEYDPVGPWSANASAWNAGSLVYGVDYTQSITISGQGLPDGTLMSWVWPWTSGPGGVYSYPEIVYGSTPFLNNASVQSTQVANFADLSTSYSITLSGYTSGFDTIFDMWLTSQPNGNYTTREYELEIVAHSDWTPPASNIAYSLTDSTLQNATVYVTPNYTNDGVSWTNITVMPASDILAGTISISDILKNLIWNGVITGQEYLSGVEFGPEVSWGTGSLLVNNLSYQWDGTPTIELATGNNTFDIVTPGGNDIQGNGGVDTVIYSGLYSQFQIKTSGSEALVMENNNISTLDVLNGVTYVEFSDGKYDIATSTFAPATSIGQAAGSAVVSVATSGTGIANGSGDLTIGSVVTLTLAMSEAVTVAGGTPTLTLNDGATATYSGGSGTNALTFSYTVAAGQNTPDLTATVVNLNSATITDGAGNAANLSLSGLTQTGPQIDTTAPVAPVITNDVVNANNSVTLTGTTEANSTVTVYDGQTAVGSTMANASGAWSYSTGALANGSQVFTATATDAAGNIGAASTAVDPIIGALTGTLSGTLSGTNSVANGTTLSITGMVNNTGTIALNAAGSGADLAIVGAATLTGAGKVTLSNNIGNVIGSNGTTATLTNANNTISGAGTIGDSQLTLNNQSTINANGSLALVIGTGTNTVTNSGTLEATSTGGLDIDANVNNSKTIEALGTNAKVVVQGAITNTSSGLILASGSGAQVDLSNATISGGTLQTFGSKAFIETVAGFNAFNGGAISSGSTVEINSSTTLAIGGAVKNSGALLVNGGTLDVEGALTGGVTDISGAGKMVIATASSENVAFVGNSAGQVVLDQAPSYTGQISGFGTTQSIDLADINFAGGVTMSYAPSNRRNTSGVLTIKEGSNTVSLELEGSYTLANFRVASDGNGGTLLTDPSLITQQPGNKAATVGNNTVLEVNTHDSGNVTFTGTSGTLWLDQPSTFTGKVSGLGAQNDIDLSTIAFGAHATLGYSPNNNNTGGTLSVTNGSQSASIALLGNYMASSFVMGSDNHGGTMVLADATQSANQSLLTNPQHS